MAAERIDPRVRALQDALTTGISPQTRRQTIEKEAERLTNYFNSLANLTPDIDRSAKDMNRLFTAQSIRHGGFVSSSFKIISIKDLRGISSSHRLKVFSKTNYIEGREFVIGFIQQGRFIGSGDKISKVSCSVPVLALHDAMLDSIAPYEPGKMLAALEKLFTYANHDYLHHLTAEGINDNIADTPHIHSLVRDDFMSQLSGHDTHPLSYESFLIESHAHNFRHAFDDDENFRSEYKATLDEFFDELKHLSTSMLATAGHKNRRDHIVKIVSYYGRSALFSMMRLFNADEEIFLNAAKSLEQINARSRTLMRGASPQKHIAAVKMIAPEFRYLMPKVMPGNDARTERRHQLNKLMIDTVASDASWTEIQVKHITYLFKTLTSEEGLNSTERERIAEIIRDGIEKMNYDPALLGLEPDAHPEDMHRLIDTIASASCSIN